MALAEVILDGSLSHDAKQARHTCNIRRSSSHEARQTLHMK